MDRLAPLGLEGLAAVGRAIQRDAQHVEVLVVAGIDADLAEVHGARVDAVDARPRLAGVGGLVDAAVFVGVGALLVLDVLALAAVPEGIRPGGGAPLLSACNGKGDLLRLLAAQHQRLDLLAGVVLPETFDDLLDLRDLLLVDGLDEIADLEAGPGRRSLREEARDAHALRRVLAAEIEGRPLPRTGRRGKVRQRGRDLHRLLAAQDGQRQLVAGLVRLDRRGQPLVILDLLFVCHLDDVAGLQSGLGSRAVVADGGQLRPAAGGVLALDAEVDGRRAHADLLGVDDGEDDARVLAIPVQADAPGGHAGQPPGHFLEGLAAVGGLVDAAAAAPLLGGVVGVVAVGRRRLAAVAVEAVALALPGGDQQRLGVRGVHANVDDAGLVVEVPDSFPGLAAVDGLVQAALLAGAVQPAEGADVDDVGVGGMNDDLADLERLLEAHVAPGLAAVGGLVDAVAVGNRVARVVLAGADPDDIAVRRRHAHVADGHRGLVVELVLEGGAVVDGLQQAARGRGDPVSGGVGLEDGQGDDAAAHRRRADRAPAQGLHPVGRQTLLDLRRGRRLLLAQFVEAAGQFLDLALEIGDLLLAGQFLGPARAGHGPQGHQHQAQRGPGQGPAPYRSSRQHGIDLAEAKLKKLVRPRPPARFHPNGTHPCRGEHGLSICAGGR